MSQVTNGMQAALYRQMVYTGIDTLACFLFCFVLFFNQQAKIDVYILVFFFLNFKNTFNIFTFYFLICGETKESFVTCENYMISKFQCHKESFIGTQTLSFATA